MEKEQLIAAVTAKFPDVKADAVASNLTGVVAPLKDFRALMEFLHNDEAMSFEYPLSQTGVDWPDKKLIWSVYHLYSFKHGHKVVVKVELDRDKPSIPTVCDLWNGCEWFERETYDMFGVVFENHPDMRRIMMTDDWVGYPLRKDYRDSRIVGKPF